MKKILFMAMIALACVACGDKGNGSGTPTKDKKALKAATADIVDLLDKDAATVAKTLTKAGFEKVDVSMDAYNKPAFKAKAPALKKGGEISEEYYIYNLLAELKKVFFDLK